MPSVSIIIPVYNLEKYILRCLNSIKVQSYNDFEVIIIDDGSTDNSYKICKLFSQNDLRFNVYSIENKGVSNARNIGIDRAKGEYIFFIDGDDYIKSDYIENLMKYGDCDLVAGGYHINSINDKEVKYKYRYLTINEYKSECTNNWCTVPSVVVWGNRYKSDIIKNNGLRFDVNCLCGEDVRFNTNYFLCISNILVVENTDYIYCLRSDSAIKKYWPNRLEEEKEEAKMKEKLFSTAPDFDWIKFIHWDIALNHYFKFILSDKKNKKHYKQNLKKCIKDGYFRTSIPFILKNGTTDMKIEAICLKIYCFKPYKIVMGLYESLKKYNSNII